MQERPKLIVGLISSAALAILALLWTFPLIFLTITALKALPDLETQTLAFVLVTNILAWPMVLIAIRTAGHFFGLVGGSGKRSKQTHATRFIHWGLWVVILVWSAFTILIGVENPTLLFSQLTLIILPAVVAAIAKFTLVSLERASLVIPNFLKDEMP